MSLALAWLMPLAIQAQLLTLLSLLTPSVSGIAGMLIELQVREEGNMKIIYILINIHIL